MTTNNKSSSIPIITPPTTPDYEVLQSKYEQALKLPIRALLLGASGSGKGVLLSNLIMDVYDKVFQRFIYGLLQFTLTLIGLKLRHILNIN